MANGTEEERLSLRPLRYALLCLIFVSMFVFFVLRVTGKVVLVWVTRVDFPVSMV